MAQRTVTVLTDDVHGGDAPASETITFALDGVGYVIDLDDEHASRLRGDLATWIGHGRKQRGAGRPRTRAGASSVGGSGVDTGAVRAWARSNGHQVSDRGRIRADVLAAYGAAQS